SGNQDFLSSPRLLGWPHQMELGPATVRVLVAVCVQTRAWGRIGHPFVEVADFLAAAHLGPPRISGLSARPWPLNVERQGRHAKSLAPEAECALNAFRRRFRASSSTRRRG